MLKAAIGLPSNIEIYIVGNAPTLEYINFCKDNKLEHVHFIKFMKPITLRQWYMASDLFVLPTREDVWGLVINEAMACGLPVVTTNKCMAGLEMVQSGINGKIVETDSPKQIQEAILELINNKDYDKLGIEAISKSKEYTIESMTKRHIELFDKL